MNISKNGLKGSLFHAAAWRCAVSVLLYWRFVGDYTNLELISTISTMETFQKIYRPEIYNANSVAGKSYQPSLKHQDYSLTRIVYDREERSRLAIEQGSLLKSNLSNHTKRFLSSGLRITL